MLLQCYSYLYTKPFLVEISELRLLFAHWLDGSISPEDYGRLAEAAHIQPGDDWQQALLPMIENTVVEEDFVAKDWEPVIAHILAQPSRVVRMKRSNMRRWWMAAACIMLMAGAGSYLLFFKKNITQNNIVQIEKPADVAAPIKNRSMIILANGNRVFLDSAADGVLATQNNVRITKLSDGQIAYSGSNAQVSYNTLSNPRGSKVIDLTLSDGTKVWLNAESSLHFPTAFIGKERKVEITGEAYFEVAHNASMPFKVTGSDGVEIKVTGTHFNVNAYGDETTNTITLLEGSVTVTKGTVTAKLLPGQQALVDKQGMIKKSDNADTVQAVAWKNGVFLFHSAGITTLLNQAARWYDVEIVYERKVNTRFNGEVPRNTPVSDLLKAMELSGEVKFSIEGKKIIVLK